MERKRESETVTGGPFLEIVKLRVGIRKETSSSSKAVTLRYSK